MISSHLGIIPQMSWFLMLSRSRMMKYSFVSDPKSRLVNYLRVSTGDLEQPASTRIKWSRAKHSIDRELNKSTEERSLNLMTIVWPLLVTIWWARVLEKITMFTATVQDCHLRRDLYLRKSRRPRQTWRWVPRNVYQVIFLYSAVKIFRVCHRLRKSQRVHPILKGMSKYLD
jgi:hypothetical protein